MIASMILLAMQFMNPDWVKMEVEGRWEEFAADRSFKPFQAKRSDESLRVEFEEIRQTRLRKWESEEFQFARQLIERDLVRDDKCCAFAYNNADENYNASVVYVGNRRLVVCEGPREKDVSHFFELIASQDVTHLVRLTAAVEGDVEKCYPYWDLPLPASLLAFQLEEWQDNCGIDPEKLLAFVLRIRKEVASNDAHLPLVHCSAGVGRSGTFLAAWAILDAIDGGLSLSIEEIVYRLSLQRIRSVAKADQYITLHRLAETYLNWRNLMEHISQQDAVKVGNSVNCTVYEYVTEHPEINMAVAEIHGRYPDKGYAVNHQCTEIGYVLQGNGKLIAESQTIQFSKGDVVLVPKGKDYYWKGDFSLVVAATPAWHADQHEHVGDSKKFQQVKLD